MKIQLISIGQDGIVRLAIDGKVTAADFVGSGGTNPIESLLGPNWITFRILIDMSKVAFIDSSAIGWLINSQKQLKEHSGALALFGVQLAVRQVLEMLRIGRVVPFVDTEASAREAIDHLLAPVVPGNGVT